MPKPLMNISLTHYLFFYTAYLMDNFPSFRQQT